jgi:pimeloyl-ACP methyl ester carboxylesterase
VILSSYLAAQALAQGATSVCVMLSDGDSSQRLELQNYISDIFHAQLSDKAANPDAACNNLFVTFAESGQVRDIARIIEECGANELWIMSCGRFAKDGRAEWGPLDSLLSALKGSFIECVNYVAPSDPEDEYQDSIRQAAEGDSSAKDAQENANIIGRICERHYIGCRKFYTPLIVGEPLSSEKAGNHPFMLFLAELDRIKAEIEERYPEYFEYQSLRCCAPAHSYLPLMHASEVAKQMIKIAFDQRSRGEVYRITNRTNISVGRICECISTAYDLNLMSVHDPEELNAVDQLFMKRNGILNKSFTRLFEPVQQGCEVVLVDTGFMQEKIAVSELRKVRRRRSEYRERKLGRSERSLRELQHKTIEVHGSELAYYAIGEGSPIVIINALGQGLRYWSRAIDEMREKYRVLVWECRGTTSPARPFALLDQVDDLDAIIRHERIEKCYMLAWCTGPKIAIEFCLRHPGKVASMVFLTGAFRCSTTSAMLGTEYENNLEPLFRVLDSNPGMAPVIMRALRQSAVDSEIVAPASEMSDKELGTRVLSLMSRDLQSEVLKPFESEITTLNYARQVLDFYSHDVAGKASKIDIPVLIIGAEYDKIASPELCRQFAQALPFGRYVELPGATHYCLYQQSSEVFDVIHRFFGESESSGKVPAEPLMARATEVSKSV